MNAKQKAVADEVVDAETKSTEVAAYDQIASGLQSLRDTAKAAKWDLTKTDDMKAAKAFRAVCVSTRTAIAARNKETKKPHQDSIAALNTEADRLTELVAEIEKPVTDKIKAEEKRKADAKEAARVAELARVKEIEGRIDEMRGHPEKMVGASAERIRALIEEIDLADIDSTYEEFQDKARVIKAATLDRLETMCAAIEKAEQDAAALKAEREELEAQREKDAAEKRELLAKFAALESKAEDDRILNEAKDREVREANNREAARLAQERADIEAANERFARERDEETERQRQAEADRIEQAEREAIEQAERDKQAEIEAEAERERQQAENERLAAVAHAYRLSGVGEAGYDLARLVVNKAPRAELVSAANAIIQTVESTED